MQMTMERSCLATLNTGRGGQVRRHVRTTANDARPKDRQKRKRTAFNCLVFGSY
jgi:hypothetical protein